MHGNVSPFFLYSRVYLMTLVPFASPYHSCRVYWGYYDMIPALSQVIFLCYDMIPVDTLRLFCVRHFLQK